MSGSTPPLPFLGLASESELRELADALPDGMFTLDVNGIITFWNRGAERITGFSRDEAIGRRCSLLAGNMANGCDCGAGPLRCGMIERGRSARCCSLRTRDGRQIRIVKNAVPLLGPGGAPLGALETFTAVNDVFAFERANVETRREATAAGDFCGMTGRHPGMRELYRIIELVARSSATVMILGESGAGKELVAEAIHRMSPRAPRPFIRVSCSALNENLLESELFGHVKGAFTGAVRDRRGRFQEADGGTLLLDEIGDVSPVVQVKLLRVIEQREIERVGDSQPIQVDVRLLCATNRDLKQLVAEGRFRADLYFRLAVFPLRVPPLREHLDDLAAISARFLSRRGYGAGISAEALTALQRHAWPGNVRELQNVLEFAVLQSRGSEIRPEHLPADLLRPCNPPPLVCREVRERQETLQALEQTGWRRAAAADVLGISRVTLWKRIRRYGICDPNDRN